MLTRDTGSRTWNLSCFSLFATSGAGWEYSGRTFSPANTTCTASALWLEVRPGRNRFRRHDDRRNQPQLERPLRYPGRLVAREWRHLACFARQPHLHVRPRLLPHCLQPRHMECPLSPAPPQLIAIARRTFSTARIILSQEIGPSTISAIAAVLYRWLWLHAKCAERRSRLTSIKLFFSPLSRTTSPSQGPGKRLLAQGARVCTDQSRITSISQICPGRISSMTGLTFHHLAFAATNVYSVTMRPCSGS